MKDLWPSNDEVQSFVKEHIKKEMFLENYKDISKSNERWNALPVSNTVTYPWDPECTYIHQPPFFQDMKVGLTPIKNIQNAFCLLNLGNSITTDHISPAGKIALKSPASKFL